MLAMSVVLQFENTVKEYSSLFGRRRLRALDDFSLSVSAGEIFGFLGPNGAGKTTAIHLAMGFMRPTRGGGRLLGTPFGNAAAHRRVGFLPENVALYPRGADELIRFYGALNGLSGTALRQRATEVLNIVRLQDHAKGNVSKFSRGMVQGVGLAQALVNDPELLILDEPTSALDPASRVAVRELLLELKALGRTIFLSSHLLSEVELICDRVAVLHRGKLVRMGRTSDLLEATKRAEIVARGIAADAFPQAVAQDGIVTFVIPAAEQRAALERVWNLGGEVVSVNPERRSLEEIFLELTGQAKSAALGGQR
jgi:ABC-2 type transport system ATP-binding protein